MIISGWHIDAFGALHDCGRDDLGPGLTVILGRNEAGKSTLLAFMRTMLFGFPRRDSIEFYKPQGGGQHGGQLFLADGERRYVLSRDAAHRNAPQLNQRDASGSLISGDPATSKAALAELLHDVDDVLFRSVFAFGLGELQQYSTLDAEGVRERIFSVGITGAGASARSILKRLADEEGALYKQRGKARVNELLAQIKQARADLAAAEAAAAEYASLVAAETGADERVAERRHELDALNSERHRLTTMLQLNETAQTLAATVADLERLPRADDPELLSEFKALSDGLMLLREREKGRQIHTGELDRAKRDLALRLDRLGSDWTSTRLAAVDTTLAQRDFVRRKGAELVEHRDAAALATHREHDAESALAETQERLVRCSAQLPDVPPPAAADVDREAATLRGLRDSLHELQVLRSQAPDDRQTASRDWQLGLIGALVLFALAAVLGALLSDPSAALGLALGGVVAAIIGAVLHWRSQRQTAPSGHDVAVAELRQRLANEAETLGLPQEFTTLDLDRRESELDEARRARFACDGSEAQVRELEAEAKAAEVRLRDRRAEKAAVEQAAADAWREWQQWCRESGLPDVTPQGALELFAEVEAAREAEQAAARAASTLRSLSQEREAWNQAAAVVVAATAVDRLSPQGSAEAAFSEAYEQLERWRELERRRHEFDERLTVALSQLDDPSAGRAELARGDVAAWESRRDTCSAELELANEAFTRAVEDRREAQLKRSHLEKSTDVPRYEAHLEALRAQLETLIERFRVIRLAGGLVQTTLKGYARERQPAVLARASRAFATVTNGRYVAVRQEITAEKEAIVVERSDGVSLAPDHLSRGTGEQLYLAIRLALVEEFRSRGQNLPLIMDDCLVNFDPGRAAKMAQLIATTAQGGQCLFFTCHPSTAEALTSDSRFAAHLIELDGRCPS